MPATAHVLAQPWAEELSSAQRRRIAADVREREVPAGALVCRRGTPAEHWGGVVEGIVKLSVADSEGRMTTLTGLTPGAWFGEGAVLRARAWDFDGLALRDTRLVLLPQATFDWLLRESESFNQFILGQLAERLAQCVALIEAERLADTVQRVARCIGWLFNPVLYPRVDRRLPLTQQEIAWLSGVSRQRVNTALQQLRRAGLLDCRYGMLEVRDLPGLMAFGG